MTQIGGPKHEPIPIGTEADPSFNVPPEPESLFRRRAARLSKLAPGHALGGYLTLVQHITELQANIAGQLPAVTPRSEADVARARAAAMPPLEAPGRALLADDVFRATLAAVTDAVRKGEGWPDTARAAAEALAGLDAGALERALVALDAGTVPPDEIAAHVLLAAAMQVHYARQAQQFAERSLPPIADGVCPACGGAPLASAVVDWPNASKARYCTCSRCSTQWNVVRVKCVVCSSTGGISYASIEGEPDTVKAETCDTCKSYVKIFWQANDPSLEPLADDIATLALDMKVAETGYRRRGVNPFLIGYDGPVGGSTADEPEPA